jgi:hypothetical protein
MECVMAQSPVLNEFPDISAQQRTSNELVKRIRKLRWIGMEEEAWALQQQARRLPCSNPVLAAPHETD